MPTVRIQEKNYSESIMVLKLKDGDSAIHRSNNKSNIFMDKRVAVKLKKLYNLEKAKIF